MLNINSILLTLVLSITSTAMAQAGVEVQHADLKLTLPAEPMRKTETIEGQPGTKPTEQHQLIVNQSNGSIIVWHQEASGITDPKQALEVARDAIVKVAGGTVSVDKEFELQGHPGRYFIVPIPKNGGEFRVAYVFANGRMYQILSVGTPEFIRSDSTNEMFKSASLSEE